jgi:hypothetical protein
VSTKPGQVQIECHVQGDKRSPFVHRWTFRLTEEDERRLRSNIANIQRDFCNLAASVNQFVFAEYEELT